MTHKLDKVNISVLTVSDTRTQEDDHSGALLKELITASGHTLYRYEIVKDSIYALRRVVSAWIDDEECHVIITTGGTGLTGRDVTCQALSVLLDREMEGFGELFRYLSFQEIGTSTIQSRAFAGVANGTYLFCLPGSQGACALGYKEIIAKQLNPAIGKCNLVAVRPRLRE